MGQGFVDALTGRGPFVRLPGSESPNLLFVTYDMVPREFWDPDPEAFARKTAPATPALDELRAHCSFSNAWCTSPLCAPSRAAFLTGRHSYITTNSERAHDGHEHELRATDIIFPEYLKAAGYRTRHVGKCHVGASTFVRAFGENDRPWDRWSPPWHDDEDFAEHLRSFGLAGFRYTREITGLAAGGGRGNSTGGWIEGAGGEAFPEEATYCAFTASRAIRSLDALAAARKPFYLQVDFFEPHQPFAIPSGLLAREAEIRGGMALPESWKRMRDSGFRSGAGSPRIYDLYRKYWGMRDESTALDYLVAHVLQFELLERQTARIFARMKELGLWENAVVLLCADHGEMNCEEALIDKGAYLNPRVLRVPLFMKDRAGQEGLPEQRGRSAAQACDSPVSLLDIAPTLLEAAGIRPVAHFDGLGLRRALEGSLRPADKPILFEVWTHVMPNPCVGAHFSMGTGDFCYVFNAADEVDELYARSKEGAWDTANLIDDPLYAEAAAACRERLIAVLASDPRWISWESFFRLKHGESLKDRSADMQRFVE
ncbi:MAG: sulfatase-like hydrolase/transferase [Spirochaetota bacterium]